MWEKFILSGAQLRRLFLLLSGVATVVFLMLYLSFSCRLSLDTFTQQNVASKSSFLFQLRTLCKSKVTGREGQAAADNVKCVHPVLDPFDPAIMQYYQKHPPVDCSSAMKDWVYVINGTFHISRDAIRRYGKIKCEYIPIFRKRDYAIVYGTPVKPMLNGMPLQSDFFRVSCRSSKGKNYTNIHAAVAWNTGVMKRLRHYHSLTTTADHHDTHDSSPEAPVSPNGKADHRISQQTLSIFMLGFDSMSRMAWHRSLPKTHKYFTEKMGAIELEDYNIMGEGTACALLPMLTGRKKEELPEARRGKSGKPVDRLPWVWKEFSTHGYVTAFAQDRPNIGAFNFQMRGFRNKPTDHYMRPFYLAAERAHLKNDFLCWGSTPRHMYFMNWFGSLLDMYRGFPKFFFGHYLEMSHDHTNRIQIMDDDLLAFLQQLEVKGHLNSTLLVLMADHGPKFTHYRHTNQGVLEGRLPYFAFRFPPWFHKRYPMSIKNLRTNTKRLTTPLDIHATFRDILNHSDRKDGDIQNRAISLLKEIPRERTCTHAGIDPHWCACLVWQPVDRSDPLVGQAVATAVNTINSYTQSQRKWCAELTLQKVTKSVRYALTSEDRLVKLKWLKFGRSHPSFNATDMYQVSFITQPGQAHFEVTCEFDNSSRTFSISPHGISRINEYGSQPACIQKSRPHMRPFCYCVK